MRAPFSTNPPAIEPAELVWHDGVPKSRLFGDACFSRQYGLNESRHVFIAQNDLKARFAAVPEAGSFVVAASGFGTGLNFLATWQAWESCGPSHAATLHFIAIERFPLTLADLEKALSCWPELGDVSGELIASYPSLVRGAHRLVLAGGRVRLTLFFGHANDALDTLRFQADAWFLDDFTPAINPEMWQGKTIARIRQHCKPGTTLAALTSEDTILRTLEGVGFRMQECEGFGPDQTMQRGVFRSDIAPLTPTDTAGKPVRSVAIIGAGIAGCLLANNLARRGCAVTLIDSAEEAGSAASGNLQGAMYVKLGVEFNHQTELALSALMFSQRYYDSYRDTLWHPTGLLQLAWSDSEQDRQRRFIERNHYPEDLLRPVTRQEAENLTGARLESGGLWFPGSGWLEPGKLCKSLALHPGVHKALGRSVKEMAISDGQWHLSIAGSDNPDIQADCVVICAGHQSPQVIPGSGKFRFKAIRGQVTHMPETLSESPTAVICGARYLNPAYGTQGQRLAVVGATFDLRNDNPHSTAESHRENIRELSAMVPQMLSTKLATSDVSEQLAGRVGFRCTTHDYQPAAGPLFDAEGRVEEGLYLLTGLGSKGLTYAPLLAEFVADQITGQPSALPVTLARRLATGRMHQPKVASS
ncbi:bifunctional tRNA (5-methylaminomethyl-2-thiouridine)(34)-methyltransferase MnmD/FAD-dependent 5-carboxymethylaminomethyl-2-thiouridine(34) oxidoreductase MnmC [Marinobacter sp.]|uniref:bifunctional tRNA (5-methylaminomethyl-2-thiouridine)(34)-methyltransferase MnmD/FAD-dependent 5-carboxymethylaminomethyl-2-thiouridine(34) oxidoreductase MnmC n=1 Tax=Marinobacter sp. TaxID=50741 RepID=UPI003A9329CC